MLGLWPHRARRQQPPPADTILVNGHIVTVDARFSIAQAVAIAGGKFTAVGTNAAIRKLAGPKTTTIDLHGQTVIPGLADGHLHDAGGGPGVDLSRTRSLADILAAVAARVKTSRRRRRHRHRTATGTRRSSKSIGCRIARDLDTVSPANPVVLVRGGHEYILNSAALREVAHHAKTRRSSRAAASRATTKGELNGELIDRAKALVQLPPAPPLTIDALVEQHKKLNAAGLTSIRYPGALDRAVPPAARR